MRINHSKNSTEAPTTVKPAAIEATDAVRAEDSAIAAARPHDPILRVTAKSKKEEPIVTSDEDSLAVSEMMAPSQPAPEVPLTEQERLLLQVVRRGDPEEFGYAGAREQSIRDEKEKADRNGSSRKSSL